MEQKITPESSLKIHNQVHAFRHQNYQINLLIHLSEKISITIIDAIDKVQYAVQQYTITKINPLTILKALTADSKQFSYELINNKNNQNTQKTSGQSSSKQNQLVLIISIEMPFIQPIQEEIHLKKIRDIPDLQFLTFQVEKIRNRIKKLSAGQKSETKKILHGIRLEDQNLGGNNNANNNFQTLASCVLTRGQYILTFSFIARPTNSWIYIYFNNQTIASINSSGFYHPNNGSWYSHTVRAKHIVNGDRQTVNFQTYYPGSYPFGIKNCIITANRIENGLKID